MSYRVEYDPDIKWGRKKEEWGIRRVIITGMFFFLFCAAVHSFWQEGRDVLFRLLLPGDAEITWSSLEQFTQNLQEGIPLRFAAREFCHGILQSGY